MEKTIENIKKALALLENHNFQDGCQLLLENLKAIPQEYYSKIFFPAKTPEGRVIVTDIQMTDGLLFYTTRPVQSQNKKKTIRFDESEALSVEVARNIISAVEVAQISNYEADKEKQRVENNKRQIELAEMRKTI